MPTLIGSVQRLELNQSSRVPTQEQLSGDKLILWQGLSAKIDVALFNDTPEATSIIDISNIGSINIIVRKKNANGAILFTEEVTSFTPTTYAAWVAETGKHATFELSELDTTQIVPDSGRLPIYFVVTAVTTDNVPYIAGFGYGEIVDVGFVDNPLSSDYVLGRTPIVGGKLLTNIDLNGFQIVDSSGVGYTEEGSIALTAAQLTVNVPFTFEKLTASGYRFDYLYILTTLNPPPDVRPVLVAQTTLGFTVELSAPASVGMTLYWKVVPKVTTPTPIPSPRYGIVPGIDDSVYYRIQDRGGEVFNVKAFGAKGDADTNNTDDLEAFQRAYTALSITGGTLFIPPGRYRVSANWIIPGILKTVNILGAGRRASVIVGDLSCTSVVQLGESTGDFPYVGNITSLGITRADGTIPNNSITLNAVHTSQNTLQDLAIARSHIGLKTNEGWTNTSQGLKSYGVYFFDCHYYLWLKTAAGTRMNDCDFGTGGETVPLTSAVVFEGDTNDFRMNKPQFLPSGGGARNAFEWVGSTVNTGYYRLHDVNFENIVTGFKSGPTPVTINDFQVSMSRLTVTGKLWDFHANTGKVGLSFVHCGSISTITPCTITNGNNCTFLDNNVNGDLTFNGGTWTVALNTFTSTTHYTGHFGALILVYNKCVFDEVQEIKLDVTGTGRIVNWGNIYDAGTQPPSKVNGDIAIGSESLFGFDTSDGNTFTVLDHGFDQPFGNTNNLSGLVLLTNLTNKRVALFLLGGGVSTIVSQTDPGSPHFTNLAGTANKTNAFINGNNAFEVNNETGASVNYRAISIRMNSSL